MNHDQKHPITEWLLPTTQRAAIDRASGKIPKHNRAAFRKHIEKSRHRLRPSQIRSAVMTRPKRLTSLTQIDQRTIAARQVRDTIAAIEADHGGPDQMTAAMQKVTETAAVTTAMVSDMAGKWLAGEEINPALFCTLANAQRRLFETLGFDRAAKDISPSIEEIAQEIELERTKDEGNKPTND